MVGQLLEMPEKDRAGVHRAYSWAVLTALLLCGGVAKAEANTPPSSSRQVAPKAISDESNWTEIDAFYELRADQPLWLDEASGDAPQQLLRLLNTIDVDGVSQRFDVGSLLGLVREAKTGDEAAKKRAEIALSRAFVSYAQAIQRDPKVGVIYVDDALRPRPQLATELLQSAADAGSLSAFIGDMGWMNPIYARLREAKRQGSKEEKERQLLGINLERARAMPRTLGRYVLVNTANQRLYMFEHGKVVDEMKVVAGRANAQTPLMNAFIRYAIVNPYWDVPSDLVVKLAPNVVAQGRSYLQNKGYQIVSDFSDSPTIIDPESIDWHSVAAGRRAVQMRQHPGPANSMGSVKFMFPNTQGIWLHDTPSRDLFANSTRLESAGCVRLEDAWRLGSWLFKKPIKPVGKDINLKLALPDPIPVFITYLTAFPEGQGMNFVHDIYKRDLPPLR